jgi:hypothetical protein
LTTERFEVACSILRCPGVVNERETARGKVLGQLSRIEAKDPGNPTALGKCISPGIATVYQKPGSRR